MLNLSFMIIMVLISVFFSLELEIYFLFSLNWKYMTVSVHVTKISTPFAKKLKQ